LRKLYQSVSLLGDGSCGTNSCATEIQTHGAYFGYVIGTGINPNTSGFRSANVGFRDMTGNGLGGFDIKATRDCLIDSSSFFSYVAGTGIELDGGSNFTQFCTLWNIDTWNTKHRIQTNNKVASITMIAGEGNCQNAVSGPTDVIANSIDLDLGATNNTAGVGTISESRFYNTQAQNCQTGIGLYNAGGNYFSGKALENTILKRGSGTVGVKVDGDTSGQILSNGNIFEKEQITGAAVGFWLPGGTNDISTNTYIDAPVFNGTDGTDLNIDATVLGTTRISSLKQWTGWTTNISAVSRDGAGHGTFSTTAGGPNNDNGLLCIPPGTLFTLFNVGGDLTFNNTYSAVTVTCNDSTGVTTITFPSAGSASSGTINTGACGGNGTCVQVNLPWNYRN
jgi:hypothetical protein